MEGVTDAQLREILSLRSIAVVGCSTTPGEDAHDVPGYLVEQGYEVYPISQSDDEIHGCEAYPSLSTIEEDVDIVSVFLPESELEGIVDGLIDREDAAVVWTHRGIRNDAAARRAREAGYIVVQDRCIKTAHQQLFG